MPRNRRRTDLDRRIDAVVEKGIADTIEAVTAAARERFGPKTTAA